LLLIPRSSVVAALPSLRLCVKCSLRITYRAPKNETTNRATTMMMTKMKAQALVAQDVILLVLNGIDVFRRAPAAIDAFPLEQYMSDETRPEQNVVVDAIALARSKSVEELEPASGCDAAVQLTRSNCLLHGSGRDCAGIVPGPTFRADLAEPTT